MALLLWNMFKEYGFLTLKGGNFEVSIFIGSWKITELEILLSYPAKKQRMMSNQPFLFEYRLNSEQEIESYFSHMSQVPDTENHISGSRPVFSEIYLVKKDCISK